MNKKKILIILVIVIVVFIIYRRWIAFKNKNITAQQIENEQLISNGQAPNQVKPTTVFNFITGNVSGNTDNGSSSSGNSEGATKSALIDALAAKHGYTFTTGQEQSLMTYSITQLENLLEYSKQEVESFLGL